MKVDHYSFGEIVIDGEVYTKDLVIEKGKILKRDKKKSKSLKAEYGHTPLTAEENIPWSRRRLIIGTGMYGKLPIAPDVRDAARKNHVSIETMPTEKAIAHINDDETNLLLHLTC